MGWTNRAEDIQEKHMYIASWPAEDYAPELWTFEDVYADWGDCEEETEGFLEMILTMKVGESLNEEDSNLLLKRVHASTSLGKGVVLIEDTYEEV
jgi:hypothetical protein